jgi:hypothetical protein
MPVESKAGMIEIMRPMSQFMKAPAKIRCGGVANNQTNVERLTPNTERSIHLFELDACSRKLSELDV